MGRQLGFLRLAVSSARNTRLGTKPPSIGSSVRRPQPVPRVLGPFLLSHNLPQEHAKSRTRRGCLMEGHNLPLDRAPAWQGVPAGGPSKFVGGLTHR